MMSSHEKDRPELDDLLALDRICLREADGGALDLIAHRQRLALSLPRSRGAWLYREGRLIAYAYLWPLVDAEWFVGGLALHPDFRTATVIAELSQSVVTLMQSVGVRRVKSHVLRSNEASLRLHRRLGFAVEQENELALALVVSCEEMVKRLPGRNRHLV